MLARAERVEEWYRRWGPMIYAHCRRLLRDDALAEDAVQEIFLRFIRVGELPDDRLASRWITLVARNFCLNLLRMRRTHAIPMEELPERCVGDLEGELDDRRFARQLFLRVPHAVRMPAALCFVEGASQEETARRLGVSLRTISNRMTAFTTNCQTLLADRTRELARA